MYIIATKNNDINLEYKKKWTIYISRCHWCQYDGIHLKMGVIYIGMKFKILNISLSCQIWQLL